MFLVGLAGDWDGIWEVWFVWRSGGVEKSVEGHVVMLRFSSLIVGRHDDYRFDGVYLELHN